MVFKGCFFFLKNSRIQKHELRREEAEKRSEEKRRMRTPRPERYAEKSPRASLCTKITAFAPVVCSPWMARRLLNACCWCWRGEGAKERERGKSSGAASASAAAAAAAAAGKSNIDVAVECKVLILGLEGAGKSSLVQRWRYLGATGGTCFRPDSDVLPKASPTEGFSITAVEWKRVRFKLQSKLWSNHRLFDWRILKAWKTGIAEGMG